MSEGKWFHVHTPATGKAWRPTVESLTAGRDRLSVVENQSLCRDSSSSIAVLVVQWFGVGLVIERSLVRLPAKALSSQLGQLSLPSLEYQSAWLGLRRGAFACVGGRYHCVISYGKRRPIAVRWCTIIQIVTDVEVTIENYFPVVGNIPQGRRMRVIFPTEGK